MKQSRETNFISAVSLIQRCKNGQQMVKHVLDSGIEEEGSAVEPEGEAVEQWDDFGHWQRCSCRHSTELRASGGQLVELVFSHVRGRDSGMEEEEGGAVEAKGEAAKQ